MPANQSTGPQDDEAAAGHSGGHLILYDGLCGLCSRLNQFVLARDPAGAFCFASLQSALARASLERLGKDPEVLTTFYVVADWRSASPTLLDKSRAALFVARALGVPWSWVGVFSLLPGRLLDAAYDTIARHRYRLFGRHEVCPLPSPDHIRRFIDG